VKAVIILFMVLVGCGGGSQPLPPYQTPSKPVNLQGSKIVKISIKNEQEALCVVTVLCLDNEEKELLLPCNKVMVLSTLNIEVHPYENKPLLPGTPPNGDKSNP
jgi:hypothetical protein